MHGLGERKPSEIMDEQLVLADCRTLCFLFKQLFINLLPDALQVQLATVDFSNPRKFALEADKLWCAKVAAEASTTINKVNVKEKRKQTVPVNTNSNRGLCFYHAKLGTNARKCRSSCNFSEN
jgi:hypothetical protein